MHYYYPGYARLPEGAHGKQGIDSCRYPNQPFKVNTGFNLENHLS